MDVKDAMDFRDPSGSFVEDHFAESLCSDDIYAFVREMDEDGKTVDDDPNYEADKQDWMMDELMNFVFFRYTGPTIPETVDEVVNLVRECSFWPPQFIWYKGTFQESPSDDALDEDGETRRLGISKSYLVMIVPSGYAKVGSRLRPSLRLAVGLLADWKLNAGQD